MTFEQYNNELNEGWKTNVIIGLLSLFGSTAMGHKIPDTHQKITTHTHNENTMKSFLKQGWSLDSTQIDTLYKQIQVSKPDTFVMVTRMKFDKNQYFESGKFTVSQEVKDTIQNEMNGIDGVITDIIVTSSTDKQGLSLNLQTLLKKMGFTPDNQGLSKARNQAIVSFLTSGMGVNNSLITSQENFEQGDSTIDQSARFVSVDIYYLQTTYPEPEIKTKTDTITKKTFYLSKEKGTKHQHIRGGNKEVKKLGVIKVYRDKRAYRCSTFK